MITDLAEIPLGRCQIGMSQDYLAYDLDRRTGTRCVCRRMSPQVMGSVIERGTERGTSLNKQISYLTQGIPLEN